MLAVVVTFAHPKATGDQGFAALEFGELSAEEFSNTSYEILPEMLAVIYRAFSETEEEQIYDSLAQVSADEALENTLPSNVWGRWSAAGWTRAIRNCTQWSWRGSRRVERERRSG